MKKTILAILWISGSAMATPRVKDIAAIKGVRDNQLLGYGLVVGLKGSGDSKLDFTSVSFAQMLKQMGVEIKKDQVDSKNVAAVVVTSELPPFARSGNRLDVTVSSIGDAKSLQGGTLLMTPLRAGDKQVYAVAQGALSVGGFAEGGGGASASKNHPTVGRIPNGGIIEKEVSNDFSKRNSLRMSLHNPDFTTAARLVKTINQELGGLYARAQDSGTVDVIVPYEFEGGIVDLLAQIERLPVNPDTRAKVVINERTGTIVVGNSVRVSTVAVAHGNLTLEVKSSESTNVTEAAPGAGALTGATRDTETVKQTTLTVNEPGDKLLAVQAGATLGDVVRGLNALGVTPRDLIGILQALRAQGALQAELEIL